MRLGLGTQRGRGPRTGLARHDATQKDIPPRGQAFVIPGFKFDTSKRVETEPRSKQIDARAAAAFPRPAFCFNRLLDAINSACAILRSGSATLGNADNTRRPCRHCGTLTPQPSCRLPRRAVPQYNQILRRPAWGRRPGVHGQHDVHGVLQRHKGGKLFAWWGCWVWRRASVPSGFLRLDGGFDDRGMRGDVQVGNHVRGMGPFSDRAT